MTTRSKPAFAGTSEVRADELRRSITILPSRQHSLATLPSAISLTDSWRPFYSYRRICPSGRPPRLRRGGQALSPLSAHLFLLAYPKLHMPAGCARCCTTSPRALISRRAGA